MKGIIFNILEDFIIDNFGEEHLGAIIDNAQLSTSDPFVGPQFYPDEDLFRIATSACELLEAELSDVLRAFGRYSFSKLKAHCPVSLRHITNGQDLLFALDKVIHVEVKKLSAEAQPPKFSFRQCDDVYVLRYSSERKICPFVEGMLFGIGDEYSSYVSYDKQCCMLDGDDYCEYYVVFSALQEAA